MYNILFESVLKTNLSKVYRNQTGNHKPRLLVRNLFIYFILYTQLWVRTNVAYDSPLPWLLVDEPRPTLIHRLQLQLHRDVQTYLLWQ